MEKYPHINQLPCKPSKNEIINYLISFLPFGDSSNALPKFVECTVFEIIEGASLDSTPPLPIRYGYKIPSYKNCKQVSRVFSSKKRTRFLTNRRKIQEKQNLYRLRRVAMANCNLPKWCHQSPSVYMKNTIFYRFPFLLKISTI